MCLLLDGVMPLVFVFFQTGSYKFILEDSGDPEDLKVSSGPEKDLLQQ